MVVRYNKQNIPGKLALRKYEPIVLNHVLFRESKWKKAAGKSTDQSFLVH